MLNFPNTPTTGQVFDTWTYDGEKWIDIGGTLTGITVGQGLSGGGTTGNITVALQIPVPLAFGGTGALSAAQAAINLGGPFLPLVGGTISGPGNLHMGPTLTTGQGVTTGDVALELGGDRTAAGLAYIDLHANSGTAFDLRIIRNPGTNGTAQILQTGTGALTLSGAGGVLVYQPGMNDPLTVQADSGLYARTRFVASRVWSAGTTSTGTFMIADETASAGRLIIDTAGTTTLSGNLIDNGNTTVSGTVTAGFVHSTGAVNADSNVTAANTVQGGYIYSTGSILGQAEVRSNTRLTSAVDVWINGLLWSNNSGYMYTASSILSGNTIQGGTINGNYIHSTGNMGADGNSSVGGQMTANVVSANDHLDIQGAVQWFNSGGYMYTNNTVRCAGILPRWDNESSSGLTGNAWAQVASYWFNSVSDMNLKTDVRSPAPGALAQVRALKPIEFHWKDREAKATPRHRGFLAQNVRDVMGRDFAGWSEENGVYGLAYNELTAVLWQAVQELAAEVEALKAR